MPFGRDHPKYGGREAGTPNTAKLMLLTALAERFPDFHPVVAMGEMYHDAATPLELKVRLLSEIAAYTVPKLKPVEAVEARRLADETILTLAAGEHELERYKRDFPLWQERVKFMIAICRETMARRVDEIYARHVAYVQKHNELVEALAQTEQLFIALY